MMNWRHWEQLRWMAVVIFMIAMCWVGTAQLLINYYRSQQIKALRKMIDIDHKRLLLLEGKDPKADHTPRV
jgi:hypothetical protein